MCTARPSRVNNTTIAFTFKAAAIPNNKPSFMAPSKSMAYLSNTDLTGIAASRLLSIAAKLRNVIFLLAGVPRDSQGAIKPVKMKDLPLALAITQIN